jgi:hypothetical protein
MSSQQQNDMYAPRGKTSYHRNYKPKPQPEFQTISLPYNVVQRLRCFGRPDETFADILTDFMDAGDKRCRLDKVTKPKEFMRQSSQYEKLLPNSFLDE